MQNFYLTRKTISDYFYAFTLAEVLITLGIIGMVAAMTIPTLMNATNDQQYKVAYKKAYSDMSNALLKDISEGNLTPRTASDDAVATESEFNSLKNAFKVIKSCEAADIAQCWDLSGEKLENILPDTECKSFVDASGRVWSQYSEADNIYMVDTNGSKKPNKYGKDRWIFTLLNADNTQTSVGLPAKIGLVPWLKDDFTTSWDYCHYPPCNYFSWLYGTNVN